uniref:Uncharacterized protein n=1 Tax=Romanomermis culicivorax TaxID=13658 RepID=A0A915KUN1_ROMCU
MAASMGLEPWWFKIFMLWNWCSVWSTMDAGTTSWRLSLIWQYRSPSSVKKTGGCFVVLLNWREAMILVTAELAACTCLTSLWKVMVMALTGGGPFVAREAKNIAVLALHVEGGCFLGGGDIGFGGHFVQGEIQFLLVGVAWKQFIKGGWFVVG